MLHNVNAKNGGILKSVLTARHPAKMPPKTGRNCPDFGKIFPGITRERHRTPGNNKEGASIKIVLKNGKIWRAALRHAKFYFCATFVQKRQFATKSGPPPGLSHPAGQDAPPPPPGTAAPPGLNPGRFPARCRHSPAGGCYQPGRPKRPPPPGHREKRPPPARDCLNYLQVSGKLLPLQ